MAMLCVSGCSNVHSHSVSPLQLAIHFIHLVSSPFPSLLTQQSGSETSCSLLPQKQVTRLRFFLSFAKPPGPSLKFFSFFFPSYLFSLKKTHNSNTTLFFKRYNNNTEKWEKEDLVIVEVDAAVDVEVDVEVKQILSINNHKLTACCCLGRGGFGGGRGGFGGGGFNQGPPAEVVRKCFISTRIPSPSVTNNLFCSNGYFYAFLRR
jgi:hypothetical protein